MSRKLISQNIFVHDPRLNVQNNLNTLCKSYNPCIEHYLILVIIQRISKFKISTFTFPCYLEYILFVFNILGWRLSFKRKRKIMVLRLRLPDKEQFL